MAIPAHKTEYFIIENSNLQKKANTAGLGDWVDPFRHENGHIASPLELTDSVTVYDMAKKSANA